MAAAPGSTVRSPGARERRDTGSAEPATTGRPTPAATDDRAEDDRAGDEGTGDEAAGDDAAEERTPTLLEQMGGVTGIVSSGVPVVVFVIAQAIFSSLTVSIVAALVAAAAITVWRLVRGEALQPALGGLLGVGVCALVAHHTGQAKGFFLLGIWTNLLYGGAFLLSVIARWPLVGVIWHAVNGEGQTWRADPYLRRGYDIASLAWTVVFLGRWAVQHWLYANNQVAGLGIARVVGILPAALAALVTLWAVRRARAAAAATAEG